MDDIIPKRQTGNKEKESLVGNDLLLMAVFMFGYPDAQADEVATFVYNQGGDVYSRQDISDRLKRLHVTRKRGSTEAYQAYLPRNVQKAHFFITLQYLHRSAS